MKIKIAYVIPTLSLGGAEKQQINILNGIDTNRFDVTLYILKNGTELLPLITNADIHVHLCHINSMANSINMLTFIKNIVRLKPDIIHSQMYSANILVRFLKLLLPSTKIINHYHGMSQWLGRVKLYLDKATSSLVERFIVVSNQSYTLRTQREGYSKNKMVLLYNSVNLQLPSSRRNYRQKNTSLTIGMASRLIPLKNIQAAIYMICELRKKGLELSLRIAGDGPQKESLADYAKALGIHEQITFIGFVSDMESFYDSIDIFCITSTTEDLPLTILEAMLFGKPIIASRIGGIPDILQNLECSILIDDFLNPKEITRIEHFINQLELFFCSKELTQYAQHNFSNETYCHNLEELYIKLMTP